MWKYSNYGPLENIAEEFVKTQTQQIIANYKKQLYWFYATTKLLDFLEFCKDDDDDDDPEMPLETKQFDKAYYRKLSMKLERRITGETLVYIDEIWRELAQEFFLPSLTAVLDQVVPGSLIITWWISDSVAEKIRVNSAGAKAKQMYKLHRIVDVKIDDECLFRADENDREVNFIRVQCNL